MSSQAVLEAIVSFYHLPGDNQIFQIDLKATSLKEYAYFSTDFSTCDECSCAGADDDVLVYSLKTMNRLAWLKGHEKSVSFVKFGSDTAMLISGSLDCNVIIWN